MDGELRKLLEKYTEEMGFEEDSVFIHSFVDEDYETKIKRHNLEMKNVIANQKIKLRDGLTKTVQRIIWVQLFFFNIVVALIVASVTIECSIFKETSVETSKVLFEFLKYYIGATIVELFGMLVFVLHYAFSESSGIWEKIKALFKKKD